MLELDLRLTADQALAACQRRGLVITSHRELAGRPGSSHWHLRIPGSAGTLELNEWRGRVWVKVHPLRQGAWATKLARELAGCSPAEHCAGRKGMPKPLDLALFVTEFKDEVRGPGSPGWVQRATLAPLAYIARHRGRAERYAPAHPAYA